ncbi:QRFP-like peptide receptor [Saccostrea echinata]|uniref:QRFP-like peptide receptor n=1 Tax=Saccostrea echinata TaxID=191078 RepID=UPI002A7FEE38|nr:QRFP-like peptide receptor [Saccostrea echinata]
MSHFRGSLYSEFGELNNTGFNITSELTENNTGVNVSYLLHHYTGYDGSYYDYNFDYDLSQIPYPKEKKSVPFAEALIKIVACTITTVVSLIGNFLVILVVAYNKRLRTTTNFYIVNLAVADLLVTFSCYWVSTVDDLTDGWILGSFFCKFNAFAQVTSLVASIMSLMLIACDRFFGIVYAMKAHVIERKAYHSLILIWILSIAAGVPMLVKKELMSRQWLDYREMWCDDTWELNAVGGNSAEIRPGRVAYYTCISFILYFIPLVVMAVAYCCVIRTLWTSKAPGERTTKDVNIQTKVKRKVVIMLVFILAVFGLCWMPLQLAVLYSEYKPLSDTLWDGFEDFYYIAQVLAFSNSAINPLLYAGFNDNFRKGFKQMFGCYKKKRYTTLSKVDGEDTYQSSSTMTPVTKM